MIIHLGLELKWGIELSIRCGFFNEKGDLKLNHLTKITYLK